ncbi:MAG: sulfatase activating formylglycine-generating enzyme [Myxococcota bacterium]|jgi:formylglycine-generating enzyme required for sulfatase activity/tRNA A-37 threonylcarbamoyl transferase component Bud32
MEAGLQAFLRRHGLGSVAEGELRDLIDLAIGNTVDEPMHAGAGRAPDAAPWAPVGGTGRYEDRGLLGAGASADVRRVWDRHLERDLAMKVLRPERLGSPVALARFRNEVRIPALLQHPGIVSVIDHGAFANGQLWFTMPVVRGQTFDQALWSGDGVSLRRALGLLLRMVEAVAYAHSHGVLHRDLKPRNVMVGAFGEVMVLDWGIARRVGEVEAEAVGEVAPSEGLTQQGMVLGTRRYMSPEQARGERDALGPPTDVFSLGVMLHDILARAGRESAAMRALADRARARDPRERPADASVFARALQDWLEGAERRARAEVQLTAAEDLEPGKGELRARATDLRRRAERLLAGVQGHQPDEDKEAGWALQDEAARLDQEAEVQEALWLQTLRSAIVLDPEFDRPHDRLAEHYRDRVLEAEAAQGATRARYYETMLRAHDRGQFTAFLEGGASVSLDTHPRGAHVTLLRYRRVGRRLEAQPVEDLGVTPVCEHPVQRGSYLLEARLPGYRALAVPVTVARGEHWHGRAPGMATPHPLPLLSADALGPDEVVVPAGWVVVGGDPEAADGLPRRRLWIDGFVMTRFPITNGQFVAFVNDLAAAGRMEEALATVPREQGQAETEVALLRQRPDGLFELGVNSEGVSWQPEWPVTMVDWRGARAYACWRAAADGLAWRLPRSTEWEKAARGVDGRYFPWGDHAEPSWACMAGSRADSVARSTVHAYPVDESPYGVRGLGGNVRDWCLDAYARQGAAVVAGREQVEVPSGEGYRVVRGGCWASPARMCRSGGRFAARPDYRSSVVGFRLVRPVPGPGDPSVQ